MLNPLLFTLTLLVLACAQDPSVTSSIKLGGYKVEERNGVQTTISEDAPPPWHPTGSSTSPKAVPKITPRSETTDAYPAGYLAEIMSLYNAITTEAAYTSVESIAAQATGVEGSAVTALSSLIAAQAQNRITFTNDAGANAYLSTLYGIYSLLPTEQQLFQSSVARRHSSIDSKYGMNPSVAATTTKGGVGRLGVGVVEIWTALGAAGFGIIVVLL